jgi:catechol 2,3-dioxygenase-like lactoylglutathione lyase family enzyme
MHKPAQEETQNIPVTKGAHHIGFTVSKLEESARFFTNILGWKEVGRKPDYPAIFVSDGKILITLWEVKEDAPVQSNRNKGYWFAPFCLTD